LNVDSALAILITECQRVVLMAGEVLRLQWRDGFCLKVAV
jgi:hypothetical protein